MHLEDVDLDQLARVVGQSPPEHRRGYVRGKTAVRDMVAKHLGCSTAVAEQLVDTMALRGLIEYQGGPDESEDGPGIWIGVPP